MQLFRNVTDATSFPAGKILFREDEPGDTMFVIVEGTVEILAGEKLLNTLGPGEFFGEMSLVDKSPRSATARTKTDCKIATIDEKRFLFMVQQTPFFAMEMMRVLSARLRSRLKDKS